MIGDPKQLPPTVKVVQNENLIGKIDDISFSKTLFVRLQSFQFPFIMLKTQYRLHPCISQLSNHLFYEDKLINGVSPTDRSAHVSNLMPLSFVDIGNGLEEQSYDGSYFNINEINSVLNICRSLLTRGVDAENIGVIALCSPFIFAFLLFKINRKHLRLKTLLKMNLKVMICLL